MVYRESMVNNSKAPGRGTRVPTEIDEGCIIMMLDLIRYICRAGSHDPPLFEARGLDWDYRAGAVEGNGPLSSTLSPYPQVHSVETPYPLDDCG